MCESRTGGVCVVRQSDNPRFDGACDVGAQQSSSAELADGGDEDDLTDRESLGADRGGEGVGLQAHNHAE